MGHKYEGQTYSVRLPIDCEKRDFVCCKPSMAANIPLRLNSHPIDRRMSMPSLISRLELNRSLPVVSSFGSSLGLPPWRADCSFSFTSRQDFSQLVIRLFKISIALLIALSWSTIFRASGESRASSRFFRSELSAMRSLPRLSISLGAFLIVVIAPWRLTEALTAALASSSTAAAVPTDSRATMIENLTMFFRGRGAGPFGFASCARIALRDEGLNGAEQPKYIDL